MSNRSLLEINHDYDLEAMPGLLAALSRYRRSACREHAKDLEVFGIRVVGMRHHSDNFIIDDAAEGFPPTYLASSEGAQ